MFLNFLISLIIFYVPSKNSNVVLLCEQIFIYIYVRIYIFFFKIFRSSHDIWKLTCLFLKIKFFYVLICAFPRPSYSECIHLSLFVSF